MEEIDIHAKLAQIETAPHFSMIFDGDTEKAEMIAEHLMWLHSIRRERPLVSRPYKVGIYIRYFNQTRYDNYDYIPEAKQTSYYDNDVPQRVAIYVRVSTDDVRQTTSFELQKRYYEDFVVKHPHWTLVNIYADEAVIIGLKTLRLKKC